jgi:transcriptional regulator with XRE-family HTH domain
VSELCQRIVGEGLWVADTLRSWTKVRPPVSGPVRGPQHDQRDVYSHRGTTLGDPQAVRSAWHSLGRQLAAARKSAGLSQEALGASVQYSRSSIANVEIGLQHVDRVFWARVDGLLATDGELLRGYDATEALQRAARRAEAPRSRVAAEPSIGRLGSQIPTAGVLQDGYSVPLSRLDALSIASSLPTRIGWTDVQYVRDSTRAFALSENTYGGGCMAEVAAAQLRQSARLAELPATPEVRQAMVEAVGNLSGVVGFSAFDVSDYRSAETCFEFELWCAENASSWTLRASALADMARLQIYLGDDDQALSLIEFAQVRSDRLPATTRAMLSAVRARLLALKGRHKEAQEEVLRSDEFFYGPRSGQDVPWMSYYDEAEHQGSTGRALVPIAVRTGDLSLAIPRMEKAIVLHDDEHPRSRVFSRTRLAGLMLEAGDPRRGAELGRAALTEAAGLKSERLRAELDGLAAIAASRSCTPAALELSRDIKQLMNQIEAP